MTVAHHFPAPRATLEVLIELIYGIHVAQPAPRAEIYTWQALRGSAGGYQLRSDNRFLSPGAAAAGSGLVGGISSMDRAAPP